MASQTITEKLRPYSTCEISDALLRLNHPRGGFVAGLSMWSPKRQEGPSKIIGPAYTVKFELRSESDAPPLQNHYIDSIPSGSVMFISVPVGVHNAAYGGLMSHRARYQGAVGTVIDGNFRDLEDHRKLKFSVFARNVATPAYYEVARPVADGQTQVQPDDVIVADLNGVVCIPSQLVDQVIEVVPHLAAADAKIELDLAQGVEFSVASKKHRQ